MALSLLSCKAPGFAIYCFIWLKVSLHLYLVPEGHFWYSPRAPAGTGSAIFEVVPCKFFYEMLEELEVRENFDAKSGYCISVHIQSIYTWPYV